VSCRSIWWPALSATSTSFPPVALGAGFAINHTWREWSSQLDSCALSRGATGAACTGPSGQTGSLTVNLKDGPYADAMAMLVTFKGVSAHHADAEWQPLTFARGVTTPLTCDLKKLVNVVDVLGAGQLLAGHYTQLRVEVQSAALYSSPTPEADPACAATMTPPGGLIADVEIPSGEVKLNRQFTIPEDGATKILLDFDGDRSVNAMGNGRFSMTPVISIVSVE
jgi:hypothetical protein